MPLAEGGVRLEFTKSWSIAVDALLPLSHQTVSAEEGEAEVGTWLVDGVLELEWARLPFGGFRSGIGAALTVTTMSGKAQPGFASSEDTVTTLAPLARSSFHLDLSRRFRLRSGVAVGVALPRVRVAFGSRHVASWGQPFLVMSLVLETTPLP